MASFVCTYFLNITFPTHHVEQSSLFYHFFYFIVYFLFYCLFFILLFIFYFIVYFLFYCLFFILLFIFYFIVYFLFYCLFFIVIIFSFTLTKQYNSSTKQTYCFHQKNLTRCELHSTIMSSACIPLSTPPIYQDFINLFEEFQVLIFSRI